MIIGGPKMYAYECGNCVNAYDEDVPNKWLIIKNIEYLIKEGKRIYTNLIYPKEN